MLKIVTPRKSGPRLELLHQESKNHFGAAASVIRQGEGSLQLYLIDKIKFCYHPTTHLPHPLKKNPSRLKGKNMLNSLCRVPLKSLSKMVLSYLLPFWQASFATDHFTNSQMVVVLFLTGKKADLLLLFRPFFSV